MFGPVQLLTKKMCIMKKLTLEEIENFYKNRPMYQVIYDTEDGREIIQEREDIDKARFLFDSERGKHDNLRLVEICRGEVTMIHREKEPIIVEQKHAQPEVVKHKPFLQSLLGDISIEEYNRSLSRFASLHGTPLENWGLKEL
jgi:hypothetical protein